jgi:hypothetical protein
MVESPQRKILAAVVSGVRRHVRSRRERVVVRGKVGHV